MKRAAPDPTFESLLQSTQALAKNIRQQHEQQQGPISPNMFATFAPQPPQQPAMPYGFMQSSAFLPDQTSAALQQGAAWDQLRNVSIDSDMAYDGIEECVCPMPGEREIVA